jgi:glutamate/tyrosine decarboxylase-like PLP-dependent enzyme
VTEADFRRLLSVGLDGMAEWESSFRRFSPHPSLAVEPQAAIAAIDALVERLHDNYPYFHPDYAAQMQCPPHQVALAAYLVTARLNPNNHALDGGRATANLERECVEQLAAMFGFRAPTLGHLTSSGTIANLEALWVASKLHPDKAIAFSQEAHYTHARCCEVLSVPSRRLAVDARGRIDLDALASTDAMADVGTIVLTAGTTACGAIDPIHEALDIARRRGWRVHVDAAYGGFFTAIASETEALMDERPWKAIAACDSVVVDPHKHGLQPYGCGAVIFADPTVGALYKHDSPYTYFTSKDLHPGEISLECSRAGAAAAALWATLRLFPLTFAGLGRALLASRRAALLAVDEAAASGALAPVVSPELDIVTLAPTERGERVKASAVSHRTEHIFTQAERDASTPLFLAKWRVPKAFGRLALPELEWDADHCTVLRSVLMKPEHETEARAIVRRIAAHTASARRL